MIGIIDYGAGNIHSVYKALDYLGIDCIVTKNHQEIQQADRLILPGVGAFPSAMENLKRSNLIDLLNEEVLVKRKPFMGICLGMQLIASKGYESGGSEGLNWISGEVKRINQQPGIKIPHDGWSDIEVVSDSELFHGLKTDRCFYFVHSYYFDVEKSADVAAYCQHGDRIPCSVLKDNIFATQFHPEKSQKIGLLLLENFSKWSV